MEIKEINDKPDWKDFVEGQKPTSLLQSWVWRDFLELQGLNPKTFFVIDKGEPVAALLSSTVRVPLGFNYVYGPRGPILKTGLSENVKAEVLKLMATHLAKLRSQSIFLRLDPALEAQELNFHQAGFRKANKEVQPKDTLILDLTQSEGELLDQMKPKTRYNIRLAQKKNIQILIAKNDHDVEVFYDLLVKTAQRSEFRPHPLKHYLDLWQSLGSEHIRVYLAQIEDRITGGIMVGFYDGTATYLHGASSRTERSTMVPYLLHWQAILDAKRNGFHSYDFWGVAPQGSPELHPWYGITRFKTGFGGEYVQYVGSYDFVNRPFLYWLFNFLRDLRKILP